MPGRALTGGLVVFALAGKRLSGVDGVGVEKPASLRSVDAIDRSAWYARIKANGRRNGQYSIVCPYQTDTHDVLFHLPPKPRI